MKVKIFDYDGRSHDVEIGELEDIKRIEVVVVTGDEVLDVQYKDGTNEEFDSSYDRLADFYDFSYVIYEYDVEKEENLLFNRNWLEREDSYSSF